MKRNPDYALKEEAFMAEEWGVKQERQVNQPEVIDITGSNHVHCEGSEIDSVVEVPSAVLEEAVGDIPEASIVVEEEDIESDSSLNIEDAQRKLAGGPECNELFDVKIKESPEEEN